MRKKKPLKPTRLCQASEKDLTANLRVNPDDADRLRLKGSVEYVFGLKHSDGTIVHAAGRMTKARDKCYLKGTKEIKRYEYTSPGLGDTRPVEIVSVNEVEA